MNPVFRSKPVLGCIAVFAGIFMFMVYRVVSHRTMRATTMRGAGSGPVASGGGTAPTVASGAAGARTASSGSASPGWKSVAEDAAYLDQYYSLDRKVREDKDAQGVTVTRRHTAATPADASRPLPALPAEPIPSAAVPSRASSRLQGRPAPSVAAKGTGVGELLPGRAIDRLLGAAAPPTPHPATVERPATVAAHPAPPRRFNPYGSVIKCELVFPLDSVNEQMPLVGVVMQPVYNNGLLVIPAGTEVHGTARPDRVRNRLFSTDQWVLVFPREAKRINGRQLNVRGLALERAEPDVNGMTWSMSDGSFGLEGTVIRTMQGAEIKRFIATFLAGAAAGLQGKNTNSLGDETTRNTPQNAALQGVSADMQQLASDIAAEVAQHGVFIHIPAGHQFYLYPTQVIDADAAAISSDIATVK